MIAAHVAKLRQRAERVHQLRRPLIQLLGIGILETVLELRAAHTILDREILHRLQKQRDALDLRQLRLEEADDLARANHPFRDRLQVDLNAPAVERGVGAVHPDERGKAFDRWILQDHLNQGLLAGSHRPERDGLRRFGDPKDHAGVLNREEALGHDEVEQHGQDQRPNSHHQRGGLVTQHPSQRFPVALNGPVEQVLGPAVERALLLFRGAPQQPRAHHRRERQRHHGGNQDRDAEGDRKLPEQPPHYVTHEQQRDQHGKERDGQGQDGEGDLLGALERRLQR